MIQWNKTDPPLDKQIVAICHSGYVFRGIVQHDGSLIDCGKVCAGIVVKPVNRSDLFGWIELPPFK